MTRRIWEGVVKSRPSGQRDTIVVAVSSYKKHPKYGKYIREVRKYAVHDELGCQVGDKVEIAEVPRISKTKSKIVIGRMAP